jgi:hypothetical protein
MNIGELFVSLGIKGNDKTLSALGSVTKGMGDAKSMSIEAKAAIVAAVYGFERMMSASGHAGTNLTNFSAITGLSAKELQKWQWAAMQAGENAEDFTGSLTGVQQAVNNMLLNKSAPEYIGMITRHVKDFDPTRLRDTFYLMTKLQEAAQNMPADLGTTMLKSFGLSDAAIAAMRRNAFTPEQFAKAPTYSEGEIKQLDRANIAWANLGNKVEMAFGHFNSKHGVELVGDITKITESVVKLAEALTKLAEVTGIFSKLAYATNIAAKGIGAVAGDKKDQGWFADLYGKLNTMGAFMPGASVPGMADFSKSIAPRLVGPPAPAAGNNVKLNHTVIFQGHHDAPQRAVKDLNKATGDYVNSVSKRST